MSNSNNPLDSLRKSTEEGYFLKKNQEAAKKLRDYKDLEKQGLQNKALIEQFLQSGFDADAVRALIFQPLIEVAWADGRVQSEERDRILKFAKDRGIEDSSKARDFLEAWLKKGFEDKSFLEAKGFLQALMAEYRAAGRDEKEWLLSAVNAVADATNSVFGLGLSNVSSEERDFIKELTQRLET